jgi:hypothetical protein
LYFGSLQQCHPDIFWLSRQDPQDEALQRFLLVAHLKGETYKSWISTCAEENHDHAALLHRICLWHGSGGQIFESLAEKQLLEAICAELPPPQSTPQGVIGYVQEIQ